jgi:hypothetical protein
MEPILVQRLLNNDRTKEGVKRRENAAYVA